jgi:signal peptidase I
VSFDCLELRGGPDVHLGQLVLYGTEDVPDVPLGQLRAFVEPDVRLETLAYFDTGAPRPKGLLREWTESLAMVVVFIVLLTGYVTQATQVPTPSMVPTIMVGDHFFIEKLAFPGNYPPLLHPYLPKRAIHRGDIIVFKPPKEQGETPFVKRVIGLPGDVVEVRERDVFINNEKLDEPYKVHLSPPSSYRPNVEPTTIPPDNFFVMGDNRDNSLDSRYWGTVPRESVIGMPLFVYWSYESDKTFSLTPTLRERAMDYLTVAMHFPTRTRWFRFGTLVR